MESKAHVKAMPPGEQIYNRVYASLVDQGVINSDNDPESENWVDPRSVDVCENCGKPHVDATKRTCKLVLMQCYAEFDKPRRTFGCRKWFHIGCIGRKVVPDEAAWWACQECCTQLDLAGISVDRKGLEFPPEDIDEGFDAAEAKKAVAKDSQPNKGDDEDEDIVDDDIDDNSADKSGDADDKSGDDSKSNTAINSNDVKDDSADDEDAEDDGKATAKVDGDSKDDEDDSDDSFRPVSSDVDDLSLIHI